MEIEKELEIIRQYNRDGNFVMAEKILSKCLSDEKYKQNISVILEMGQLLSGECKFIEASEYFEKVLQIDNSNIHAWIGFCKCFIFLNKTTKLRRTMNLIKTILKNKDKKEKTITWIVKEVFYNKIFNEKLTDNDKKEWFEIVIDNINELETEEKTNIARDISLHYRQQNELNKEEKFLKNIILSDPFNSEINKMYIDSLTFQQKYKEAYKNISLLELKDKRNLVDYVVNNLIRLNTDNIDSFDGLDIDSMLLYYSKLIKIKYLKNDPNFIKKTNSLLLQILVSARQKNYKIKDDIYIKILKQQRDRKNFNIKNSIINEMEWTEKKITLKSKPRVIQVLLTNECNSQCKMCSINKDVKWELTDTGFNNIAKLLKYSDSVTWQGGEVRFYKKFRELVNIARKYNVSQHIITNGINWDENLLKEVMHGDMNIAVSADGFDADTYEYIRGVNGFDKMQEFMSMFNKHRTNQNRLKMYTTVMNANINQMHIIPEFAIKNKIDEVVLSPLKKLKDNNFFYKENIFFKENGIELVEYNNRIKKINQTVERLSKELINTKIKFISYLPKIEKKNTVNSACFKDDYCNHVLEPKNTFCQAPWKHIAVNENGLIMPSFACGQSLVLGDINSCDILKIWNSLKIRDLRKDLINSCSEKWCGKCKSLNC